MRENTWETVDPGIPPTDAAPLAKWNERNQKACGTIKLLVEKGQRHHIVDKKTTKEMWVILREHNEEATLSNKVAILRQIYDLRLNEEGNAEEHLSTLCNLVNQVTALGKNFEDDDIVAIMLSSLPESYGTLVMALEARPETDLTQSLVKGNIIAEWKRRSNPSNTRSPELALKTNNPHEGNQSCFLCHKKGHRKATCGKFLLSKQKHNPKGGIQKASTAQADHKVNRDSEDGSGRDYAFMVSSKTTTSTWYFDSGATKHMTNSVNFFTKMNTNYRSQARVANERVCEVFGIGSGIIECQIHNGEKRKIELNNVLYVPSFDSGLISVRILDKKGFKVIINKGRLPAYKGTSECMIGDWRGQMYELRQIDRAYSARVKHTENCIHTWHRRFGHRDPVPIKALTNGGIAEGIRITECCIKKLCESCIQGKGKSS
ncbi:uncharacterized protein [Fopius arisanus]|uniref:GAG-pre-integrase domain-containing protein n=1 Tax=Fopius arisanus TaxID=64838 RepID=A0A9R1UAE1_9HYME|nr:PREDICTED: uncharacterized protein LOC105272858 [Fopius arisanus]